MAALTSRPPIRISKVANRYLLFDIDDVMYLRRSHNICSVFVGTIPQNPQQNVLMGIPLELMAEEAQILVARNAAYVVDDAMFHPARLKAPDDSSRHAYLRKIVGEGKTARQVAAEVAEQNRPEKYKQGGKKKKQKTKNKDAAAEAMSLAESTAGHDGEEDTLFAASAPDPKATGREPREAKSQGWTITPTTSGALLPASLDQESFTALIDVPSAYPLFAHLQEKGYFMMPGLRFGCDYNVYPGDPMRFHSHFQATHFGWDEEINLLDIVTGGRLGTVVKKSFLVGGEVLDPSGPESGGEAGTDDEKPVVPHVRAFSIEWAGM